MRDLEIRGAGNLLGAEQHGHMEAVGYDMYMRILSEAIAEEKGEAPVINTKECLIDLRIDAHIPEDYIENLPHRLHIYKRIADIKSKEDASDVLDELIDRFGDPPQSVEGLITVSLLRNTAANLGIYEVGQNASCILLYVEKIEMNKTSYLLRELRGRVYVSPGAKPCIAVKRASGETTLDTLKISLDILSRAEISEAGKE